MHRFDNQFLTYAVALHGWLNQPGYGALFTLSFLASTLLPLGSEWLLVLMLTAGYSPLAVVTVATVGNSLGGVTCWIVGLYGGRWFVERLLKVSPDQQERARAYYRRFGAFTLFFSWLPFIGDPLCVVAGMMRIDLWLFTLLVASGKLFRYAVTAWLTVRIAA